MAPLSSVRLYGSLSKFLHVRFKIAKNEGDTSGSCQCGCLGFFNILSKCRIANSAECLFLCLDSSKYISIIFSSTLHLKSKLRPPLEHSLMCTIVAPILSHTSMVCPSDP